MQRRTLTVLLSVMLATLPLFPARSSPQGLSVPVRFTMRIRRMVPNFLIPGAIHITGSLEGEVIGLQMKGDLSVNMIEIGLPLVIFTIPIARRASLNPATLVTPAGSFVVYGGASGKKLDPVFIEADPEKGTGAFLGIAARGTVSMVRALEKNRSGEFYGQVTFSWPTRDAALQAISEALEANTELGESDRAGLLSRVRQALDSATVAPFPPSPVAANPPPEQKGAPDRPQVEWDGRVEGGQFKGDLRIVVPKGPTEQQLRVMVIGPDGAFEVYNKLHAPGQRVEIAVFGTLPAIIQVYLDHLLIGRIKPEESEG